MHRRDFITLFAGVAATVAGSRNAFAQQQSVESARQIGVLMSYAADDPEAQQRTIVLEQRLHELGWTSGGNLKVNYRWAGGGDAKTLQTRAAELVAIRPDVIVCQSTPVLAAVRQESKTIPIVFAQVTDPVGGGFVASLARPGGRITGFSDFEYGIGGKWMELLKQAAPKTSAVAVVTMAGHAGNGGIFRVMEGVAPGLGIRLAKVELDRDSNVDRAIGTETNGLIVLPSPVAIMHREAILASTAERHLPGCFPLRYFAASGGLMSYGVDQVDEWRMAAAYVDRILRGEKPADLPVQQPSKFEFIINLKTAHALGLDVPPWLLASADEVIQ
jgi:putative tryptophan/tyrosine transport system substrate-binding protein